MNDLSLESYCNVLYEFLCEFISFEPLVRFIKMNPRWNAMVLQFMDFYVLDVYIRQNMYLWAKHLCIHNLLTNR